MKKWLLQPHKNPHTFTESRNVEVVVYMSAYNAASFNDFKKEFPDSVLELEPKKKPVSQDLRGYYYGVVIPTVQAIIPEWSRLSDDEVHEILKRQFNGFNFFNPITKRTDRVGKSVMGLDSNSPRAMDYIDKIRMWLATEYYTELPNPMDYLKFLDQAKLK